MASSPRMISFRTTSYTVNRPCYGHVSDANLWTQKTICRRMWGPKFWPICNNIPEIISLPKTVIGKTDYYDFISIQSKSLKPWIRKKHFSTLHQHSVTLLLYVGVCVHIHGRLKLIKGKSLVIVCVHGFINVILLGALRSCSLSFCAQSTMFYTHFLAMWPLTQDPPNPPTTKGLRGSMPRGKG